MILPAAVPWQFALILIALVGSREYRSRHVTVLLLEFGRKSVVRWGALYFAWPISP